MSFSPTTKENTMKDFTTVTDVQQTMWDSESRKSPYSTVCDPDDVSYCEGCDQDVDYSVDKVHGRCGCDA